MGRRKDGSNLTFHDMPRNWFDHTAIGSRREIGGFKEAPFRSPRRGFHGTREATGHTQFSTVSIENDLCLPRSEEHTSELQSLMRTSYAVFCLKKKKKSQQYYVKY